MSRPAEIARRLIDAGLSLNEAEAKAGLFAQASAALEALASDGPAGQTRCFFVPGRIEVLGKHTDYAGGRSLLCAAQRGFCVLARGRSDRLIRVLDARHGPREDLTLDADLSPGSGWTVFPRTVARRVARDFSGALQGADIAFASDLPRAAGLSSSSALVIALFTALSDVNGLRSRPEFASRIRTEEDLAEYLSCLESGSGFRGVGHDRGVGAMIGGEDHTAILCSRRGEIARYCFCPVRREGAIALPLGWTFVVASSGVASDKAGVVRDRYNRLALLARSVLEIWREESGRSDPTLFAAASSSPEGPDRIREALRRSSCEAFPTDALRDRFDQFFQETVEILPAAASAISRGDRAALGELVDRSQAGAENLLRNQIPETSGLARLARAQGAIAASAFGAGFGGSVWALVEADEVDAFQERWKEHYRRAFPAAAGSSEFFQGRPGPALQRLD